MADGLVNGKTNSDGCIDKVIGRVVDEWTETDVQMDARPKMNG